VLLHIVFYAKIGSEQNEFTLQDVIEGICTKLINRHPHIYGDVKVADDEDVKKNWEQIKMKEGKKSVLSGVPGSLPAIIKATRIQDKAKQVGFEWDNKEDVWKKVEEEMNELQEAVALNDRQHIEEEFGDVLFSLANYARFLQIDAEGSLERTNKKFISRFTIMEEEAARQGRSLYDMSLREMDAIWNDIKLKRSQ
jgi:XTP/dITP diphosphohydrolase